MTEGSRKVFEFLKENHGMKMTAQEVAKELDVKLSTVTGSVNGLTRKGYAVRTEETVVVDGKNSTVKYIALTDAGMAFDPDAVPEKVEK